MDIFDIISDYTGDVLLIHGTKDQVVPYSYSEKALQTYANGKLYTIEGGGHGFHGKDEDTALIEVYLFIEEHIN